MLRKSRNAAARRGDEKMDETGKVNVDIKQVNDQIEKAKEKIKHVNDQIEKVDEKIKRVILGTAEYAKVEKEDREKILVGLKSQLDGSIKSELSRLEAFLDDLRSQLSRLDADKGFFRSQLSKLDAEKEQWIKMLQQKKKHGIFYSFNLTSRIESHLRDQRVLD